MSTHLVKLLSYSPTSQPDILPCIGVATTFPMRRLQPNLTRKPHKKSRKGCLSCKKRKIKCDEEKPTCKHCLFKSTPCIYPPVPDRREELLAHQMGSVVPSLSAVSDTFTLQDMQFFHHFLCNAYPHLPLGNESVWVREIPQFAQQHSFLMHAMLGLGASHLGHTAADNPHQSRALMHRGRAISGFNQALAKSELAYGEGDALLATCYALTFQSTHMADGLADFITFVRGCSLTITKIRSERATTAFDLRENNHMRWVEPHLEHMPQLDAVHVMTGARHMEFIYPLLSTMSEVVLYRTLHNVLTAVQESPQDGYKAYIQVFSMWYSLSSQDFNQVIGAQNATAQVLLAFMVAIKLLMVPLTCHEWPRRPSYGPFKTLMGVTAWAQRIFTDVPAQLQHLLTWPKTIVEIAVAEMCGQPHSGASVLMHAIDLIRADQMPHQQPAFLTPVDSSSSSTSGTPQPIFH